MKSIFEYENYKLYSRDRVKAKLGGGHGEFGKIARALNVHPPLVSQVLRGPKDFTLEQATDVCVFWGLKAQETEYFQKLVLIARAGNSQTKLSLQNQLARLRSEGNQVATRLQVKSSLSEADRAIFYSNWIYSATRLASSLPDGKSVDAISEILQLPASRIAPVVDFLIEKGLCKKSQNRLAMGPQSTHLSASSPMVSRHHMNWRLKALEHADRIDSDCEILFTAPVSVSRKDAIRIRKRILEVIEELVGEIRKSPEEQLSCLNIDWFTIVNPLKK